METAAPARYDTTVPEAYWPQADKPWRVSWGIGAFEDFATEAEAVVAAAEIRARFGEADWADSVNAPFNAYERWAPMRIA